MNHINPLSLVASSLPMIAISYQSAQSQINQWVYQSQTFSVNVIVKPEGATIQLTNSYHHFQLCDGLGRCKLFKSIPSLHQRLHKLVPNSHSNCVHFDIIEP